MDLASTVLALAIAIPVVILVVVGAAYAVAVFIALLSGYYGLYKFTASKNAKADVALLEEIRKTRQESETRRVSRKAS